MLVLATNCPIDESQKRKKSISCRTTFSAVAVIETLSYLRVKLKKIKINLFSIKFA
jgi:hypothetical protein